MVLELYRYNIRMGLKILGLIVVLGLGYKFGVPAYTVYSAKKDLANIGIPFSEQKFVESACNGDQGTVELFIKAGININVLASIGKNDGVPKAALHCAAAKGILPMAKSLIEQGANINIQDEEGNTPLSYVAIAGISGRDGVTKSLEMAKLFIMNKADINLQGDKGNPFLTALILNQYELADYLAENGADVKSHTKDGSTALIEISKRFYGDMKPDLLSRAKSLVSAGVDVNAQNKNGDTALMIAGQNRQYKLMEALLDLGADPNLANNSGLSPISTALYNAELFNVLVAHGADLNIQVNGSTLLHQAILNNSPVVGLLLSSGKIDVNAKNDNGETALFLSISHGAISLMQSLLAAGASPDITNSQLQTPLIRAAINNAVDIARILIDWNANVNMRDGSGHTALFYANQRVENMANHNAYANGVGSQFANANNPANRPTVYNGKVYTPMPAPLPSPVTPAASAPSAYDTDAWRRSRIAVSGSSNYRDSSAASSGSKITVTDPMVNLLVKAGAHL